MQAWDSQGLTAKCNMMSGILMRSMSTPFPCGDQHGLQGLIKGCPWRLRRLREREPRREIVLDVVVIDGNNSILQNEDACCLVHAMPLMSANGRRGRIYLGTCSSVIRRVEPSPCFMSRFFKNNWCISRYLGPGRLLEFHNCHIHICVDPYTAVGSPIRRVWIVGLRVFTTPWPTPACLLHVGTCENWR